MDIDVMAKHIPALLEFKKRVEAMIEDAEAGGGGGSAAEAIGRQIADLRSQLNPIQDEVAALRVLRESDQAGLKGLLDWFVENREGLDVLLSIGDSIGSESKPADKPTDDGASKTGDAPQGEEAPQGQVSETQPTEAPPTEAAAPAEAAAASNDPA